MIKTLVLLSYMSMMRSGDKRVDWLHGKGVNKSPLVKNTFFSSEITPGLNG